MQEISTTNPRRRHVIANIAKAAMTVFMAVMLAIACRAVAAWWIVP